MGTDIEAYKVGTDARVLLELLAKHRAPALVFRRIAGDLAAEVLPLTDDERCRVAVEAARAFAVGQTDAASLAIANVDANAAFRVSTTGVLAMSRVAAVNASGRMTSPAGPALAAQSAAQRAAEAARFANSGNTVEIKQVDVIRSVFSVEAFTALVATSGAPHE